MEPPSERNAAADVARQLQQPVGKRASAPFFRKCRPSAALAGAVREG